MKTRQFCSVCKQYLEMEVVPTGDGDDDGVVWFRCPRCQGFLPKLGDALAEEVAAAKTAAEEPPAENASADPAAATSAPTPLPTTDEAGADLPWDSPADMLASQTATDSAPGSAAATPDSPPDVEAARAAARPATAEPAEPIAEYAALLAERDPADAVPYRPWQNYEVGQCVLHLAWEDCGVVVAKEELPGSRRVIKCYFSEAGVVRLIEQEPR